MTVRLHIERLVIDVPGIADSGGAKVRAALEAELHRRVSDAAASSGQWRSELIPALRLPAPGPIERLAARELGQVAAALLSEGLASCRL
jgi:hypothetical protein